MKTVAALFLFTTTLTAQTWSPQAAASYLDTRMEWWSTWSSSQRDHQTFCISCHTVLPYALGRQSLRTALHESGASPLETTLVANLTKRVRLWNDVEPFYPDAMRGAGKTLESRGTEAILNALALVSNKAPAEDTTLALDNMLALQIATGDAAGAWPWLQFHNAPWEGDSQYFGATLAALAIGRAPATWRSQPKVKTAVVSLRRYLASELAAQTLMDRLFLVWANTIRPDLLTPADQKAILTEALAKQQSDGGFSLSHFIGAWRRKDNTPLLTQSDGYATGVVALVLQQTGTPATDKSLSHSLAWLNSHQDPTDGRWPAWSVNKNRELNSDAGRFMSDAATAFAVMALTANSSY